jgi:HlyD family secretion protein
LKKIIIYICLPLFLCCIYSCTDKKAPIPSLFTINEADYVDELMIDGTVEPVQISSVTCPNNIDGTILWLAEDGTYVNEGDTICILEDKNLTNNYNSSLISLEGLFANQNKVKADLAMQFALLDADVKNNQAQTEISRLDSLQLNYSSPSMRKIKELELQKAEIERKKLMKKLQTFKKIQQSELRKQELQIKRMQTNIDNNKQMLLKLKLTSPKSGMLIRSIHWVTNRKSQVGDPVWGGMPIFTIPEMIEMKVKILAREGEYKRIEVGDSVSFMFDAMPDNQAFGKILKKAPVGKPLNEKSKVKFFEIEASIQKTTQIPTPGLSVKCEVFIQHVKDTIVIPQISVFEEDSMKVVYVKQANGFEKRQIIAGISSPKQMIVTRGLTRNEIIALSKPDETLVTRKVIFNKSDKKTK